jgi:hypothetical protein
MPSNDASLSLPAIVIGENTCHSILSAMLIAMKMDIPCPNPCFSMTSSRNTVIVLAMMS